MIARAVSVGWQTILADLSLILFMVTASALADAPDGPLGNSPVAPARPAAARTPPPAPQPHAEPIAVWRPDSGAPSLSQWLDDVARDPRLRLTITVHFAPGGQARALAQAARLNQAAGAHGANARIVVEPGQPEQASAVVGYDAQMPTGTPLAGHGP